MEEEIAGFERRLDEAVRDTMENEAFGYARSCILAKVMTEVYDKYKPTEYERRYDEGGLSDYRNIEIEERNYDAGGGRYEIGVRNLTEGIDGEGPIDTVIEEGVGYTWKGSRIYAMQPYPRPFYAPAEAMIEEGNYLERALGEGLERNGL